MKETIGKFMDLGIQVMAIVLLVFGVAYLLISSEANNYKTHIENNSTNQLPTSYYVEDNENFFS